MLISPILVIIGSAILLFSCVFFLVNRPRIPIITGTLLFLLICFALMTFVINMHISSSAASANTVSAPPVIRAIVGFITMNDLPTQHHLAESFSLFCKIDIGLILAVCISMFIEVKTLLSHHKRSRGKK